MTQTSERQLIRLLSEAHAVLTAEQVGDMAASMDLSCDEVRAMLNENEERWEELRDVVGGDPEIADSGTLGPFGYAMKVGANRGFEWGPYEVAAIMSRFIEGAALHDGFMNFVRRWADEDPSLGERNLSMAEFTNFKK